MRYSKECKTCGRRYPSACGIATCLECKDALEQTQKIPTVEEEEFKLLSYVYGRVIPGPLKEDVQAKWDADWEALEEEAERRSPWWSVADLLADWPSVRPTA